MDDKLPESFFNSLLPEQGGLLFPSQGVLGPAHPHPAIDEDRRQGMDSSAAQLRLLVDALRDAAIFFLDAQGRIADWPPSAERLLGYSAAQVVGQSITRFSPTTSPDADPTEADNQMALALERSALLGQSETRGWQRRADGSLLWANTLLTVLNDSRSEDVLGYACLMRDTTENKRLLDLLHELNAALETRVEERTRQLQEINNDLEAFTSSVSHDLRAPLRHISSFVQLLREDLGESADAGTQRQLDTIAQAADHMGMLIEGLLAFSRLGRSALRRQPVHMGDLVRSSQNRVQHDPLLRRPVDEVVWSMPAEWPTVQVDGQLMSQVWDNLLSNALKYSRHSQPAQISLGSHRESGTHGGDHWVFWIRDNGAGFNPQRAERLFGMFQRLHRASEFEGTGIGLALCRRIVERHGGRIWAISEPKVGSTFCFSLPVS